MNILELTPEMRHDTISGTNWQLDRMLRGFGSTSLCQQGEVLSSGPFAVSNEEYSVHDDAGTKFILQVQLLDENNVISVGSFSEDGNKQVRIVSKDNSLSLEEIEKSASRKATLDLKNQSPEDVQRIRSAAAAVIKSYRKASRKL